MIEDVNVRIEQLKTEILSDYADVRIAAAKNFVEVGDLAVHALHTLRIDLDLQMLIADESELTKFLKKFLTIEKVLIDIQNRVPLDLPANWIRDRIWDTRVQLLNRRATTIIDGKEEQRLREQRKHWDAQEKERQWREERKHWDAQNRGRKLIADDSNDQPSDLLFAEEKRQLREQSKYWAAQKRARELIDQCRFDGPDDRSTDPLLAQKEPADD